MAKKKPAAAVKKITQEKKPKKSGQPRIFETAQRYREAWRKYFDWADNNPWYKNDFVKSGELAGMHVKIPTQRPFSIMGFQSYYDLSGDFCDSLIRSLKESGAPDYQEYLSVYEWAKNKCTNQRIEGGLVGAFNANLVGRIDHLVEKTDLTTNGKELPASQSLDLSKYSYEQLKALTGNSEADKG